ncbi:PDZ domain-containing protein [Deinococcus reticulitermitis]|uniref:PDZ domain-containing protein n=1 Tax=Deinococcus reticulitermitis TaxID=856736 RepID=A0A1H7CW52_9DEIO|nr:PDZ domain-containing protein [Deinococcus reticulitermitis]SEJ93878.1 PDZ domain-containing protein [Deinococcus reticulitermitis]
MREAVIALFVALGTGAAAPIPGNVLQGKIVDWPAERTGTLRLAPLAGGMFIARGSIDASGNFKINLPDLPDRGLNRLGDLFGPASNLRPDCTGAGRADPADSEYQIYYLNVVVNGREFGDATYDNSAAMLAKPDSVAGTVVYFSKPAVLDGKVTCGADKNDAVLKGNFAAGWQMVLTEIRPGKSGDSEVETYLPAAPLPPLQWRVFKEYGGTGVMMKPGTTIVESLSLDGPAQKAGLQSGDQILTIDGKEIKTYDDTAALRGDPNTVVTLTVKREGEAQPVTLKITRALVRVP